MAKRKSSFVTAGSMTLTDFEISHPFVTVRAGSVDKFDSRSPVEVDASSKVIRVNKVDKALLDYFLLEHVLPTMQKAAMCHQRRSNELKIRGIAASFFPLFTHLAPKAEDAELLKKYEGNQSGAEAMAGFYMQDATGLEKASSSSQITADGLDGHSRDCIDLVPEDGDDLGPRQAVDFRGYGYGHGEASDEEEYEDFRHSFTLLITDSKQKNFVWDPDTEEDSVLYQLADYASCAAIANMIKHRYKPIYMTILADGDWACAVLQPRGYLRVENGMIEPESFNEFLGCMKEKWCQENPNAVYQEPSQADKDKWLERQNKRLSATRQKMKKLRMADTIPGGRWLLVGNVVFNALPRTWTRFPIDGADTKFTKNDYVLMSGMMRVLYGDRVLSWTKETLQALSKARDDELAALNVSPF